MATVGIGLPVYNGENYLRESLESLLAQTWTDFELIISDNASTDGTEGIGREFAARDSRIRYLRNVRNIGAAANYNQTFRLSSSPYFKWMAHDDLLAPGFVETCLKALLEEPQAVLACSAVSRIDEQGRQCGTYDFPMRVASPRPEVRFADLVLVRHPCTLVFGLMRRQALVSTGLQGDYTSADRCFLAELALRGPFREVPGYLCHRRDHPDTSCRKIDDPRLRNAWFNPSRQGQISFPEWRVVSEYLQIIGRSPLPPGAAWRCRLQVAKVVRQRWRHLLLDALLGGRDVLQLSAAGQQVYRFCRTQLRRVGFDPYAIGQPKRPKSG